MKTVIISLILLNGGLLKIELYDKSCHRFWEENITQHERKKRWKNDNLTYHTYKGQEVVGYHCSNKEPT